MSVPNYTMGNSSFTVKNHAKGKRKNIPPRKFDDVTMEGTKFSKELSNYIPFTSAMDLIIKMSIKAAIPWWWLPHFAGGMTVSKLSLITPSLERCVSRNLSPCVSWGRKKVIRHLGSVIDSECSSFKKLHATREVFNGEVLKKVNARQ